MVSLADLPEYEREHLLAKNLPPLGPPAWVRLTKPISELMKRCQVLSKEQTV